MSKKNSCKQDIIFFINSCYIQIGFSIVDKTTSNFDIIFVNIDLEI